VRLRVALSLVGSTVLLLGCGSTDAPQSIASSINDEWSAEVAVKRPLLERNLAKTGLRLVDCSESDSDQCQPGDAVARAALPREELIRAVRSAIANSGLQAGGEVGCGSISTGSTDCLLIGTGDVALVNIYVRVDRRGETVAIVNWPTAG